MQLALERAIGSTTASNAQIATSVETVAISVGCIAVLYNARTARQTRFFRCERRIQCLALSDDGSQLAVGLALDTTSDIRGEIDAPVCTSVWSLPDGVLLFEGAAACSVERLAFSHCGKLLATVGTHCGGRRNLGVWSIGSQSRIAEGKLLHTVHALAFAPDDTHVVTCGSEAHLRWWPVPGDGRILRAHPAIFQASVLLGAGGRSGSISFIGCAAVMPVAPTAESNTGYNSGGAAVTHGARRGSAPAEISSINTTSATEHEVRAVAQSGVVVHAMESTAIGTTRRFSSDVGPFAVRRTSDQSQDGSGVAFHVWALTSTGILCEFGPRRRLLRWLDLNESASPGKGIRASLGHDAPPTYCAGMDASMNFAGSTTRFGNAIGSRRQQQPDTPPSAMAAISVNGRVYFVDCGGSQLAVAGQLSDPPALGLLNRAPTPPKPHAPEQPEQHSKPATTTHDAHHAVDVGGGSASTPVIPSVVAVRWLRHPKRATAHHVIAVYEDRSIFVWDVRKLAKLQQQGMRLRHTELPTSPQHIETTTLHLDGTEGIQRATTVPWPVIGSLHRSLLVCHAGRITDIVVLPAQPAYGAADASLRPPRGTFATCSDDCTVRLWNLTRGEHQPVVRTQQQALLERGPIQAAATTTTPRCVVSSKDEDLSRTELASRVLEEPGHEGGITGCNVETGTTAATAFDEMNVAPASVTAVVEAEVYGYVWETSAVPPVTHCDVPQLQLDLPDRCRDEVVTTSHYATDEEVETAAATRAAVTWRRSPFMRELLAVVYVDDDSGSCTGSRLGVTTAKLRSIESPLALQSEATASQDQSGLSLTITGKDAPIAAPLPSFSAWWWERNAIESNSSSISSEMGAGGGPKSTTFERYSAHTQSSSSGSGGTGAEVGCMPDSWCARALRRLDGSHSSVLTASTTSGEAQLQICPTLTRLAASPDGTHLVVGDSLGQLRVFMLGLAASTCGSDNLRMGPQPELHAATAAGDFATAHAVDSSTSATTDSDGEAAAADNNTPSNSHVADADDGHDCNREVATAAITAVSTTTTTSSLHRFEWAWRRKQHSASLNGAHANPTRPRHHSQVVGHRATTAVALEAYEVAHDGPVTALLCVNPPYDHDPPHPADNEMLTKTSADRAASAPYYIVSASEDSLVHILHSPAVCRSSCQKSAAAMPRRLIHERESRGAAATTRNECDEDGSDITRPDSIVSGASVVALTVDAHTSPIAAIVATPDSRVLASCSAEDGVLLLSHIRKVGAPCGRGDGSAPIPVEIRRSCKADVSSSGARTSFLAADPTGRFIVSVAVSPRQDMRGRLNRRLRVNITCTQWSYAYIQQLKMMLPTFLHCLGTLPCRMVGHTCCR